MSRRRLVRRVKSPSGYTRIWFLVEGESRQFRCEHLAGWFQILREAGSEAELVCTYGAHHRLLSGFYLEPPVPIEEPFHFEDKPQPLSGVQLWFEFARPRTWQDCDWSLMTGNQWQEHTAELQQAEAELQKETLIWPA